MHRQYHRDIAADNILVRDDGTPVLLDFGSARSDLQDRAGPVTAIVKSGPSPPEQYKTNAEHQGPWSDIYAFAATLYQAIMGQAPMDAMDRLGEELHWVRTRCRHKTHQKMSFLAGPMRREHRGGFLQVG